MKRKSIMRVVCSAALAAVLACGLAGCAAGDALGSMTTKEAPAAEATPEATATPEVTEEPEATPEPTAEALQADAVDTEKAPDGMYFSELTGEPISLELKEQRPIAVMIDNESIAWPHYGTAEGDVVYELMNSTLNGRITRLMVLYKDYENIKQIGSVRSTRPSNVILAAEYNAVLCHDGGPTYIYEYLDKDYGKQHFSGTFSRVDNGKPREFTEYILTGDMDKNFQRSGFDRNYNEFRPEQEPHFPFVPYGTETDLSDVANTTAATEIVLPFPHTTSTLKFNDQTKTYDLYCYGKQHLDAEDNEPLTFKNLIIEEADFTQYDSNGYINYHCLDTKGRPGYYITNGKAQKITWTKWSDTGITKYFDENGNEIKMNRGKTYITIVPTDSWDQLSIK